LLLARLAAAAKQPAELIDPTSGTGELEALTVAPSAVGTRALPAVQREALVLAYRGGFTQREIALRTGAPLGTVKSRMLVGMRRLHDGLSSVVPALIALPGAAPVAPAG
jgi:DNA-directed RNA polymerase specialized sigma24 family protein